MLKTGNLSNEIKEFFFALDKQTILKKSKFSIFYLSAKQK